MANEILTIHDLFAWARTVIAHVADAAAQSAIRATAATDRAAQALVRGSTAAVRAESALAAAAAGQRYAAQLEETAARFQMLRIDPASLTSIGAGIASAVSLAQASQRRAEAEAAVANIAAALAAAEQNAAEAAAAEAQAAQICAETVQVMHDTVRTHQMPHAEAQAVTGNAAAHSSVLAVN